MVDTYAMPYIIPVYTVYSQSQETAPGSKQNINMEYMKTMSIYYYVTSILGYFILFILVYGVFDFEGGGLTIPKATWVRIFTQGEASHLIDLYIRNYLKNICLGQ